MTADAGVPRSGWPVFALAVGGFALVTAASLVLNQLVPGAGATDAWLYLLVIVPLTLHWGRGVGLAAAAAAALILAASLLLLHPPADHATLRVGLRLAIGAGGLALAVLTLDRVNQARLAGERRLARRAAEEQRAAEREALLATVVHDLRSPLTVIAGSAQLLQRRLQHEAVVPPWLVDGLASITAGARQIAALAEDLLLAGAQASGRQLTVQRTRLDLAALVQLVVAQQRERDPTHPLALIGADAALCGWWDGARLARVLGNLLENAAKYSPPGCPIHVAVAAGFGPGTDQPWVELTVQDQGMGVPAADLPHLFTPYYRARNVAGRIAGTGLGLASVRAIVAAHGGTVAVASVEGQGTTVTLRLPRGVADPHAVAVPAGAVATG